MTREEERTRLAEVAKLALKLGFTAFGGPAAHIGMLRQEVVDRRGWISEQEFLDMLGTTNLIPGPSSTEMMILVGHRRAGWRGLLVGGAFFILPAACIVLVFAWAYVRYGSIPTARWLLYGIKPVIIGVVAQALWQLSRTAIRGPILAIIGIAVLMLYLAGVNELILLLVSGLVAMVVAYSRLPHHDSAGPAAFYAPFGSLSVPIAAAGATPVSLLTLFLTFLKIGAVLYGGGYVLLAFLRNDFVNRLHWLTDRQLLDAVAVGQFTPGPLLTTATFVGYIVGSWWGAVLATVGIFLPSFAYVAVVRPLLPHLRRSPPMAAMLDGVNAAAVGLMAAVTLDLARSAIVDPLTVALALLTASVLIRFKVNSVWLVLAGGVVGVVCGLLGGVPR